MECCIELTLTGSYSKALPMKFSISIIRVLGSAVYLPIRLVELTIFFTCGLCHLDGKRKILAHTWFTSGQSMKIRLVSLQISFYTISESFCRSTRSEILFCPAVPAVKRVKSEKKTQAHWNLTLTHPQSQDQRMHLPQPNFNFSSSRRSVHPNPHGGMVQIVWLLLFCLNLDLTSFTGCQWSTFPISDKR